MMMISREYIRVTEITLKTSCSLTHNCIWFFVQCKMKYSLRFQKKYLNYNISAINISRYVYLSSYANGLHRYFYTCE